MSEHPPEDGCLLRRPWPDELARVRALLPSVRGQGFFRSWLWVLVTGSPERLIGAAALLEPRALSQRTPPAPAGRIDVVVAPAWQASRAVDRLVAAACATARSLRLGPLTCTTEVGSATAGCLLARGFAPGAAHELWTLDPAVPLDEFGTRFSRGLERHGAPEAIPLATEHLAAVQALCGRFGLLPPERVALQPAQPEGFDPRFSFVSATPGGVGAAILARRQARGVYLEVFARDEALCRDEPMAASRLAYTLLKACRDEGVSELTCVVRPGETPELVHMLRRGGARRVRQVAGYTLSAGTDVRAELSPLRGRPV